MAILTAGWPASNYIRRAFLGLTVSMAAVVVGLIYWAALKALVQGVCR